MPRTQDNVDCLLLRGPCHRSLTRFFLFPPSQIFPFRDLKYDIILTSRCLFFIHPSYNPDAFNLLHNVITLCIYACYKYMHSFAISSGNNLQNINCNCCSSENQILRLLLSNNCSFWICICNKINIKRKYTYVITFFYKTHRSV